MPPHALAQHWRNWPRAHPSAPALRPLCLRRRSQAHRWPSVGRDFARNPSTSSTTLLRGTRPRGISRARAKPSSFPRLIDTELPRSPTWSIAPRDALKRGVVVKSAPSSVACRAIITLVSDLGKHLGASARLCIDILPAKPARWCSGKVMGIFARDLHAELLVLLPRERARLAIIRGMSRKRLTTFQNRWGVGGIRPISRTSTCPIPTRPRSEKTALKISAPVARRTPRQDSAVGARTHQRPSGGLH